MKIVVEKKSVTAFYRHGEPKKFSHVKGAMFMQKIAQDSGFSDWTELVNHVSQLHELPFVTSTEELKSQKEAIANV